MICQKLTADVSHLNSGFLLQVEIIGLLQLALNHMLECAAKLICIIQNYLIGQLSVVGSST